MRQKKVWTKEAALQHIAETTEPNDAGCHEWQGSRTKDGYGQISRDSITDTFGIKLVHRLVVHLVTGHEFAGRHEQVMHACHNRSCCNPEHLSIGSARENVKAAWARGSMLVLRGEANPNAVLTDDMVRKIRQLLQDGWQGVKIAKHFGLNPNLISKVKIGRSWTHVT